MDLECLLTHICVPSFMYSGVFWCWERLRARGKRGENGWDDWMASQLKGLELQQTQGDSEDRGAWHAAIHGVTNNQIWLSNLISSVQFSSSVVSDSLRPHELQHARPPCPSPSPRFHVHHVNDAIQPSHPLLSPSPPALNLSQHQGLFQWVSSLHQVAKVLEFQLQH